MGRGSAARPTLEVELQKARAHVVVPSIRERLDACARTLERSRERPVKAEEVLGHKQIAASCSRSSRRVNEGWTRCARKLPNNFHPPSDQGANLRDNQETIDNAERTGTRSELQQWTFGVRGFVGGRRSGWVDDAPA